MESVAFEEFGIDKCLNDKCNQPYTKNIIKLSVWLHGLILLTQQEVNAGGDELLGHLKQEKVPEEKLSGYIGITCPKCLKTKLYKKTSKEVKEFKAVISSMIKLDQSVEDGNGTQSEISSGPFPLNLRYYSPFVLKSEILKDFNIEIYGFDEPEDDSYFFDDFIIYIAGEEKDFTTPFCSYIIDDSTPVGIQTLIYWFKEQDIENILELENATEERIFPRYHYFNELMKKADALLKYNYRSEMVFLQVKNEHRKSMDQYYEQEAVGKGTNPVAPPDFKELFEKNKNTIISDPKMTGNFLEFLISDPHPLKSISKEPLNRDYLWATINPFYEKGLPNDFTFANQFDDFHKKSEGIMKRHQKIVPLVKKSFKKPYVQDFLGNKLIEFLEAYEGLIQSNNFSYATVWGVKENYLEELYETTLKGLADESLYVMKREGNSWKIVFDETISSPLNGRGFAYIYHLLSNENDFFYHYELYLAGGGGKSDRRGKGKSNPNEKKGSKIDHDDTPGSMYKKPKPMIEQKDLNILFKEIKKTENNIHDAQEFGKKRKESALKEDLTNLKKYISQVYDFKKKKIRFEKNEDTIKATNSVAKAIERVYASEYCNGFFVKNIIVLLKTTEISMDFIV